MSYPPPAPDDQQQPFDYYAPAEDNAPRLVRLAVIFNYVSVGLDALLSLLTFGLGLVFALAPDMAPQNPGDPEPWVLAIIYLCLSVVVLIIAIVKLIATRKLHLLRPNAWGWGLTAGILGCVQFVCGSCCCLQVAGGIYTVVILSLSNVRLYLASAQPSTPSEYN